MPPLTRWFVRTALVYLVAALLAGLGLAAGQLVVLPPAFGALQPVYFHLLMVGWITQLIFGHAPLILPAVTGRPLPYQPYFYSHVILLHAALVLRVIGDLAGLFSLRQWGGLLNGLAILLFLGNTIWAIRRGARQAAQAATRKPSKTGN